MKLSKVEITNFRCFESLAVRLQPDINVFVGVNGAGKTSVLDAVAMALYDGVAANGGGGKRQRNSQAANLRPEDIRITPGSSDPVITRARSVSIHAEVNRFHPVSVFTERTQSGAERLIEWTDDIQFQPPVGFVYETSRSANLAQVYDYFRELWQELRRTGGKAFIPFPVVAYYRADRRLRGMPDMGSIFEIELDRPGAYAGALNAGANYKAMCQWFYLRENQELREKLQIRLDQSFELPDLKAAREALLRTLEGVKRVFFDENPPSLKVAFDRPGTPDEVLKLAQLSDGYRNLLAVVLDFARRLAQAHPNWPNPLEAPGIMLIDEIDLHLHPTWQQRIVPNLHAIFPNTQLIIATHSPYVVTTVESRCVQIAENAKLRPCPTPATFGARSSDIVSEVMGLESQRPPNNPIASKISALFEAIDNSDLAGAKMIRAELNDWAKGFPEPDLVRADLMIKRLEVKANGKNAAKP